MAKNEKKSDKYARVHERLELANRWRTDEGYDDKWQRLIDLYRGKTYWNSNNRDFWSGDVGKDRISVNLAFSTVNVIAPSVSVNHPKITVTANKEEDEDRAIFVESAVNYLWRHHDYRKPFRRMVKDFLICGHGWLKVGWKFVEVEREMNPDEFETMYNTAVAEATEAARLDPQNANT